MMTGNLLVSRQRCKAGEDTLLATSQNHDTETKCFGWKHKEHLFDIELLMNNKQQIPRKFKTGLCHRPDGGCRDQRRETMRSKKIGRLLLGYRRIRQPDAWRLEIYFTPHQWLECGITLVWWWFAAAVQLPARKFGRFERREER